MNFSTYGFTEPNIGLGVAMASQSEVFGAFGKVKSFNENNIQFAKRDEVFYFQSFPERWEALKGLEIAKSDRKIAFLVWESSEVKEAFKGLEEFDEVWTASQYCKDILDRGMGVESKVVGHFVNHYNAPVERGEVYRFMYMFDGRSRYIRKNPFDLIKAFKLAFGKRKDVSLTIKCKGLGESILQYLKRMSEGFNVDFMIEELSYVETMEMLNGCDCYVSPHRSEGVGLTLLEAMGLGKLVMGTGLGGNMDFMDEGNSVVLDFDIKETDDEFYPGEWGYVSVDHLVDSMRMASIGRLDEKRQAGFETALDWGMSKGVRDTQKALG